MTEIPSDGRHLTFSTLDQLWTSGTPMVLPIQGEPECLLQLDPSHGLITLRCAYLGDEPNVARLKNLTFNAIAEGEEEQAELSVRVDGNVHGAYGLLATIADEVQVNKLPLAAAVAAGVARYRNVLTGRVGLTTQEEVGLFGELLFLEFLIHEVGVGPAVSAWQGPLSEEHDFTFADVHIEVKTTSGEFRKHVISGLGQMVPLQDIPLYLLSIQITRTTPDGGPSLPQLVNLVKELSATHPIDLDARLSESGWREEDSDLYETTWVLQSEPRAYLVDGDFPAMTPDRISSSIPNHGLVSDVSYRVDLTHYDYDHLPHPLTLFAESKEG